MSKKTITLKQIHEITRLYKTLKLPCQTLPRTYDDAEKIISEIKSNWGE